MKTSDKPPVLPPFCNTLFTHEDRKMGLFVQSHERAFVSLYKRAGGLFSPTIFLPHRKMIRARNASLKEKANINRQKRRCERSRGFRVRASWSNSVQVLMGPPPCLRMASTISLMRGLA